MSRRRSCPPWGLINSSTLLAFMWIGFVSKWSVISSPWISRNRPGRSNERAELAQGLEPDLQVAVPGAGLDPGVPEPLAVAGEAVLPGPLVRLRPRSSTFWPWLRTLWSERARNW